MPKTDYSSWSKEDLIKKVKALEKRKKYGLVWDSAREPEKVVLDCQKALPVLKEISKNEILTGKDNVTHVLIEGDNYHTLSVLNYTHEKSVDLIYIDPPYNTGNDDFIYNDRYIDIEDPYRHTKWLSFMDKRLRLVKPLLKKSGVIFISIDDNELAHLKLLCDDIFGEANLIGLVTVAKGTTTGQDAKHFGSSADYLLVYAMPNFALGKIELSEKDKRRFTRKDDKGNYSILQWRKTGNGDRREDRPNLYYPIAGPDGKPVHPIGPTGYESRWRGDLKRFKQFDKLKMVEWIQMDDGWRPYIKYYLEGRGKAPSNLWTDLEGNKKATIELKEFFGERVFTNPKPTDLIKRCISLSNAVDPLVLDFFAGSGTTAQAVLDLNSQDDGNRRFILCTNNENNICSDVCYPRIQKMIKGYRNSKGEDTEVLGGNLKYYTTSFVPAAPTDKNKELLTKQSIEMLTLKEGTFEKVTENPSYVIYTNYDKYTGIIFDQLSFNEFKKAVSEVNKPISLYIFSLSDHDFSDDFADMRGLIKICAIPESILRVYRRIFR